MTGAVTFRCRSRTKTTLACCGLPIFWTRAATNYGFCTASCQAGSYMQRWICAGQSRTGTRLGQKRTSRTAPTAPAPLAAGAGDDAGGAALVVRVRALAWQWATEEDDEAHGAVWMAGGLVGAFGRRRRGRVQWCNTLRSYQ